MLFRVEVQNASVQFSRSMSRARVNRRMHYPTFADARRR